MKTRASKYRTPWTRAERTRLEELVESGVDFNTIARRLRRPVGTIKTFVQRDLGGRMLGGLSSRGVGTTLGLPCHKVVLQWIAWDWLAAQNIGTLEAPRWRIQPDDLWTFLQDARYTWAWSPATIPDPDLRAWAIEVRKGLPRWLSVGEVAAHYGVPERTAYDWVWCGRLPSVEVPLSRRGTRKRTRWVSEADLAGFVPPSAQPKKKARAA